jgi:hypothetical protein
MARKALTPLAVRGEPLIYPCHNVEKLILVQPPKPTQSPPVKTTVDILLRGFWAQGTNCIVDIRVTDTDAKSYRHRDPAKVIATQEKEKKWKYLERCLEQ